MASPLFPIETHAFAGVLEAKSASLLRKLTRKSPQAGITSASHLEIRPSPETASFGIRQVDALTGGLPRGCLTEVSGADSSGRTSLMLSALAAATCREEICALIDVSDAFDPHSAAAAGVDLGRLLWVRCGSHAQASALSRRRRQPASLQEWERRRMEDPVEQALRATDLLLQSSGFGMNCTEDGAPYPPDHMVPLPASRGKHSGHSAGDWGGVLHAIVRIAGGGDQSAGNQSPVVSCQFSVLSSQFSVLIFQGRAFE